MLRTPPVTRLILQPLPTCPCALACPDLKLELRRTAPGLTPLYVVLHSDTGRKGVFDYGPKNLGTDAPRAAAGDLVWAKVLTH